MSLLEEAKKNANRTPQNQERTELYSSFLQEKVALALEVIYDTQGEITPSDVSRFADTTYSHAVQQVQKLEDLGLVRSERRGRKKHLFITEKGELVAEKLVELDEALEQASEV